MPQVPFGTIHAHAVDMKGAIDHVAALVRRGRGYVVTPNVDHVVQAAANPELRAAYHGAALSLADGTPLIWLSRLIGQPLPEKVSGSDLLLPLVARAALEGWRVYLLGGAPQVGERARHVLRGLHPELCIVGVDAPPFGFERDARQRRAAWRRLRAARPNLVLVALGCPKQELLMHEWSRHFSGVMVGVGASLDFLAGVQKRAPRWLSQMGLEWLYRLAREPRRLAHRYLVRDLAFIPIALRAVLRRNVGERLQGTGKER